MKHFLFVLVSLVSFQINAVTDAELLLEEYRLSGATTFNKEKGKDLWNSVQGNRSCTSCHSDSPAKPGKHIKTGKIIAPMAPSLNLKRFNNSRKIEKWFLRNCKWTLGRACTIQEKGDILSWLITL